MSNAIKSRKKFTVYMLRTSGGTYYAGQTKDIKKRMRDHRLRKGKGSKYMRSFKGFTLVYAESYSSLGKALRREYELKKLSHKEKEELARTNHEKLSRNRIRNWRQAKRSKPDQTENLS